MSDFSGDGTANHSSPGTSPYNSDLAYGGSSSDDSLDSSTYAGLTGQTSFAADTQGQMMRRLHLDIAGIRGDFQAVREMAGQTTVRFGPAPGGGVGATTFGDNGPEIMLDPNHAEVREGGSMRLLGTATFEFMNAAQSGRRAALDYSTGSSRFAERAAELGMTPAQHYGRENERIEFDNALAHRLMVHDAGRAGTHMDIFQHTVPRLRQSDVGTQRYEQAFQAYYAQQYQSGHTQSYEGHYPQAQYDAQAQRRVNAARSTNPGGASGKNNKHHKGGGHGHGHGHSSKVGRSRR
ncbi:MAG TPA: hypothetical protein VN408_12350 [Actinoplanes sp.]|nr:hypothetical protein [Actinoplanes sp.]